MDKAHETAQALSTHGPELLPGHRDTTGQAAEQSQADQQAVSPRSDVAGEPQPASAPSQAAAANQAPVQRPALPLADMAALAQRIGTSATASASQAYTSHALHQSSSAQLPLAAAHHPHADVNGKASSVSADNTVPPELQAIIQKLVAFIKVGPSGQAGCLMKQHTVCHTHAQLGR